jgi:hypothetical protein
VSLFDKKHLVSQADALPGRNTPMPVATLHAVNGHSMTNVPMEWKSPCSPWAASGALSASSGSCPAFTARQPATRAATRRIQPTAKSAPAKPAMRKRYAWCMTRRYQLRTAPAGLLGKPRPGAGHASGQRPRHAVPLGYLSAHA